MMTREEYRATKEARQLLRDLVWNSIAPLTAEIDAALAKLQKAHAEYIKDLRPFTGARGSAEEQAHMRTMEVCRSLIEAEAPLRSAKQDLANIVMMNETEEWSERLAPIYAAIAKVESVLSHVDGTIRKTGKSVVSATFTGEAHGERFRKISKASLKPTDKCPQEQIDKLAEYIGL